MFRAYARTTRFKHFCLGHLRLGVINARNNQLNTAHFGSHGRRYLLQTVAELGKNNVKIKNTILKAVECTAGKAFYYYKRSSQEK